MITTRYSDRQTIQEPNSVLQNGRTDDRHLVQFYESDEYLQNPLAAFIGTGLLSGDVTVVVATSGHLDKLERILLGREIDLPEARRAQNYIALDAETTLARLRPDGQLSQDAFKTVIGNVISEAFRRNNHVRVFGELVALLCEQGNFEDAVRLESFWNELLGDHPFKLMCAYPLSHFADHALAGSLAAVCHTHSQVLPTESYSSLSSAEDQARYILHLQQKASALELELARSEELLHREQAARSEAEIANRMKDDFLATVSHELRTPLNAIIGWSHMLRSGRLDAQSSTRAIETIERNAKSQAQLVEDILDVSRMITGKLSLKMELVDAAAVIHAAIDSVQLAADSKEVALEVTFDTSARHVLGDSSRLQQVVWNLLSNAIKFTPQGGRVTAKLERVGSTVQITVTDTGQGISHEFLPCVFERFRQLDASSTRRYGGLGLGLAIVRHLVELHGGTVTVDSAGEGCGATFTISLPAPAGKELKSRQSARFETGDKYYDLKDKSLFSLKGVRVLLVDDDGDSLQFLWTLLDQQGAEIRLAQSAPKALEVLESYAPDVLVFDLAMPDEDGFSLIEKIRAREIGKKKRVPAIALTAHVRVDDRVRALAGGFDLFVPKPVEVEELITAIANLSHLELIN